MTRQDLNSTRTGYRIKPTPLVGGAVILAYMGLTFALQLSTGLEYSEWLSTAGNGLKAAVIPLAVGSALLIAFLAVARWDMIWRDPGQLPVTRVMKVAMVVFVGTILVRFAGMDWGSIGLDLLLVVIAAGILVGFAEETLFRGIVLRSFRTSGRTEAKAMLWMSLLFGLFHLPNTLVAGPTQVFQVITAAMTGATLYAFRRYRGLLLTGMIAHAIWDMSTFLAAEHSRDWSTSLGTLLFIVSFVLGVAVVVSVWRTDQTTVVTPAGIEQK